MSGQIPSLNQVLSVDDTMKGSLEATLDSGNAASQTKRLAQGRNGLVGGCLYVCIRKSDLAERRFDRCLTMLQCT